jgi:hypothetical protein
MTSRIAPALPDDFVTSVTCAREFQQRRGDRNAAGVDYSVEESCERELLR